jgi:hypothetical protein
MNFSNPTSADVTPVPIAMSIPDAVKWSGLSRSEVYRRLKVGDLRAKKMRSRTLILTESLRECVNTLPDMA